VTLQHQILKKQPTQFMITYLTVLQEAAQVKEMEAIIQALSDTNMLKLLRTLD
jgi:phenylalanine-4-hydroxylase